MHAYDAMQFFIEINFFIPRFAWLLPCNPYGKAVLRNCAVGGPPDLLKNR